MTLQPHYWIYVVVVGREPGLYNDWGATQAQVDGFSGARYKKFRTMDEALEYWYDNVPGDEPAVHFEPGAPASIERGTLVYLSRDGGVYRREVEGATAERVSRYVREA